jgi:hypothetical protein
MIWAGHTAEIAPAYLSPQATVKFVERLVTSDAVTGLSDYRHLVHASLLPQSSTEKYVGVSKFMAAPKVARKGADWTQLLADPQLGAHLGKLLAICRDAAPEQREKALFDAIREIRQQNTGDAKETAIAETPVTATEDSPPFEPDIFKPSIGQDRRKYPRIKCFVAVELRVEGSDTPLWGNLSNTSLGGCLAESPAMIEPGKNIEIGLWVANGTLWIKGIVLTGVVTQSTPSSGVRIKFTAMESPERETLRQFLRFVENTNQSYQHDHGYLAQMKS